MPDELAASHLIRLWQEQTCTLSAGEKGDWKEGGKLKGKLNNCSTLIHFSLAALLESVRKTTLIFCKRRRERGLKSETGLMSIS